MNYLARAVLHTQFRWLAHSGASDFDLVKDDW